MVSPRTTRSRRSPYAMPGPVPWPRRPETPASDLRREGDPAAGLLHEPHVHALRPELECGGDVVADLHRERLGEHALVAEASEVELERLRLEAERVRLVLDERVVEVRLGGDRADGRQLVARQLHPRHAGVRERLEAGVVLRA